ncbi:MAG: hypothetical protein OXC42_03440 [Gammaproteobacteria bacterium]|nr:hypothetical protein [Gammaproteobacteria bacterium]
MHLGRNITTLLISIGLLCTAQSILADESGSFSMLTIWKRDYSMLERPGKAVTIGTLKGVNTILESSRDPFVAGNHSLSNCLVYAKKSEDSYNLEAHCTMTDVSNDKLHMGGRRHKGDTESGGGGSGVWKLLGGTGKYLDVSGTCDYRVEYLEDNWLVNTAMHCNWHRP